MTQDSNFWNDQFEHAPLKKPNMSSITDDSTSGITYKKDSLTDIKSHNNLSSGGTTYTTTTYPPIVSEILKSDRAYIAEILDKIKYIINTKNNKYTIDPITILTTEDLLTQIKIKAVRAQLCKKDEVYDELYDIIVYSILTLSKLMIAKNDKVITNAKLVI
jgi:hypothetical protein